MWKAFACAVPALLLAACASSSPQGAAGTAGPQPASSTAPAAAAPERAGPLANGASIFRTGTDLRGARITAQPPPLMPSCAACHRADGSGGVHLAGGAVSADLRHRALVDQQKPPYTVALLERAISRGVDNTGQPLNRVMPRWRMSQSDLHDVAQYVLTALK